MNNRELKDIIEQIQAGTGHKLIRIAKDSGIGRSYLSTLINDETLKDVEAPLIGKLTKQYPAYFAEQKRTTDEKVDQILSSLKEIREYAISILTGQSAGNEVIMGALDRLEDNPEGSLSEAADKLAIKLAKRMTVIQTGNKAGAHK